MAAFNYSLPGRARLLVVVAVGVLIASVVASVVTAAEALEERAAAVAATDFRLATLTVSSFDPFSPSTTLTDRQAVVEALHQLASDRELALHPVDDPASVEEMLDVLVVHGERLLAGQVTAEHTPGAHAELQAILRDASIAASADAAGSERRAEYAAVLAIVSGVALATIGISLRTRSQRRRVEIEARAAAGERFETLLDDSPDATVVFGVDGVITYRSASLAEMFPGVELDRIDDLASMVAPSSRDELHGHLMTPGANRQTATYQMVSTFEEAPGERWIAIRVSDQREDDLVGGFLACLRDITAEQRVRRELEIQATTDQLTGLPNRRAMVSMIGQASQTRLALLLLDLDNFKRTNDMYGHEAGDLLLTLVARRAARVLEDRGTLFRLGGDEFAIVMIGAGEAQARSVANLLLVALERPVELDQGFEPARTSIGIAFSDSDEGAEQLLRRADIALYEAKRRGGNQVQVVAPEMELQASRHAELARAVSEADIHTEFHTVYQPIVEAESGRVRYIEALLRWNSPRMGPVSPAEFIPVAESSGAIAEIGAWVLDQACTDLASWRSQGLATDVVLTVNVSPRQLLEDDFCRMVDETVARHGLSSGDIAIEVTESEVVGRGQRLVHRLAELHGQGYRIAVDDFGSGFSNLGSLLTLPLDMIKVDRELLVRLSEMRERAGGDPDQPCGVMQAIVHIGAAMRVPVVAEGVETEMQRLSLVASGVPLLQGYLFSRPVLGSRVPDLLEMPLSV